MSDGRLKPCPFCGAAVYHVATAYGKIYIRCPHTLCDVRGPHRQTEAKAIAAWNRRAPPEKAT